MAVQLRIPLIVWGENSQNEYGGPAGAATDNVLTRRWLEEFGGLLGLRVSDLVGHEGIEQRDLIAYTYPTDQELCEHFDVNHIRDKHENPIVAPEGTAR